MHSPLSKQEAAHCRDASGPSPDLRMSSTPLMMSFGAASATPAGATLGQTSTHLPHRVQASSISLTRSPRAVSNDRAVSEDVSPGCIGGSPVKFLECA